MRFVTYAGGILLTLLGFTNSGYWLIPLAAGFITYLASPLHKFIKLKTHNLFGKPLLLIPFLLVFIDVAKMAGYISGVRKRIKRRRTNVLSISAHPPSDLQT